ncbi:MAG: SlyX family protein [Planctomycetota bacterium]
MDAHDSLEQRLVDLTRRMINLESNFLHLQQAVDDLHEGLLRGEKRADAFSRQLAALTGRFNAATEEVVEPRSLEEEKPPHY